MPLGFQDTVVTSAVSGPSVLAFAPDGRLFVGEKGTGRIHVIQEGTLLTTPFLDLDDVVAPPAFFDTFFERGLLGITFDPSFASNGFVYVYYTICKVPAGGGSCASAKNRVARFTASGSTAVAGSELVILDDIDSDAGNHNAGWIDFGPDGKLYVAVGDGGQTNTKAQDLGTLNGKLLRIDTDGSIPADNPFVGLPGVREEIWASGFRNPWRCRFQPLSGRLFCADVGQSTWEEVDIVEPGENYGWPVTEGPFDQNDFAYAHPIDWYSHGVGGSITGGDFGARTNFPGDHQQSYFYADFVVGFIRRAILDETGSLVVDVESFATGLGSNSVTDLVAGPDGSLYYADYSANEVHRISATASPVAVAGATPTSGLPDLAVQFSGDQSTVPAGSPSFLWDFDDGATSTEANPLHTFTAEGLYTVTLTVDDADGATPPGVDTVEITVGQAPAVTITAPSEGQQFAAGDTVTLTGSADDAGATLAWEVIFHHNTHIHPFLNGLPGGAQSFVWATNGEAAADVGYEIILRATAANGLVGEARRTVLPILGEFTLASNPSGRVVTLDGQPRTTPFTIEGVVGFERTIGVPSATGFLGWSDGGAATHTIASPAAPTTYTASFTDPCASPTVIPADGGVVTGTTAGNSGLSGTCGGGTAPEKVFSWTPSASGTATIETCGAGTEYDTVLFVREASCTGTQVGCNDDTVGCATTSGATHGSQVGLTVSAGTTYFIVVDGFQARAGEFSLTVVPPGAAPTTPAPRRPARARPRPSSRRRPRPPRRRRLPTRRRSRPRRPPPPRRTRRRRRRPRPPRARPRRRAGSTRRPPRPSRRRRARRPPPPRARPRPRPRPPR